MNNLLASTPFMIFGALVLLYVVLAMSGGGRTRAGSSKSLSGSLSKVLMGSGSKKKSSKRSSGGKKYMGFTMTQILVGAAVVAGIYYYKEGFNASVRAKFNDACDSRGKGSEPEPDSEPSPSTNTQQQQHSRGMAPQHPSHQPQESMWDEVLGYSGRASRDNRRPRD